MYYERSISLDTPSVSSPPPPRSPSSLPPPPRRQDSTNGVGSPEEEEDIDTKGVENADPLSEVTDLDHFPALAFYDNLDKFVVGNLKKLSKILSEQTERAAGLEEDFRFLYFNHMNLALKTSLHGKAVPLTMETIKLIRNIHADFKTSKLSNLVRKYNVVTVVPYGAPQPSHPQPSPPLSPVRVQLPTSQDEMKKSPVKQQAPSRSSSNSFAGFSLSGKGNSPSQSPSLPLPSSSSLPFDRQHSPTTVTDGRTNASPLFRGTSPPFSSNASYLPAGLSLPSHRVLAAVLPAQPSEGGDEPPHGFLPLDLFQHAKEGTVEVCIKTKANGWVVGRRATQSHREFFVLIDDKVGNLADIQEEVDHLARTYFCNIFIH